MAAQNVNLLPKELTVSKEVAKQLKVAKKITITTVVIFTTIMAAGAGATFYFSNNLTELREEQEQLKTNITSLESTEQLLLLTKDRVNKIQGVISSRNNEEVFKKQKVVLDNLPDKLSLAASEIERGETLVEIEALNSRDLASFLRTLTASESFANVVLKGMTFNINTGFKVQLDVK